MVESTRVIPGSSRDTDKVERDLGGDALQGGGDVAGGRALVGDHRSGRLGHMNFDMEARGGQHVHQGVETE